MHIMAESGIGEEEKKDTRKWVKRCTERDSRTETSALFLSLLQSRAGLS